MLRASWLASGVSIWRRLSTMTCCSGGQALGKSHCSPDFSSEVGTPLAKFVTLVLFRFWRNLAFCSLVEAFTHTGKMFDG